MMLPGRPSNRPVAGDIVVTKVARHYHVGRVQPVGTVLLSIAVANRQDEAIAVACVAVTGRQRAFLSENPGSPRCIEIGLPAAHQV